MTDKHANKQTNKQTRSTFFSSQASRRSATQQKGIPCFICDAELEHHVRKNSPLVLVPVEISLVLPLYHLFLFQ